MQIYWFGQSCFQLVSTYNRQKTVKIVIDPFSSEIGLRLPSLEADIALISHDHYDHNNLSKVRGNPFLIREPGEYELKGVFIQAIPSFHDEVQGKERGKNLIFTLETEDLEICHLGDFGQKQLSDAQVQKIGPVDILMIPVGGVYTIDGHRAQKVIAQLEPKIVIPMHYSLPKLKIKLESLDKFLKAMGQALPPAEKKLKIQKKDLPESEEETKIVVLEPKG